MTKSKTKTVKPAKAAAPVAAPSPATTPLTSEQPLQTTRSPKTGEIVVYSSAAPMARESRWFACVNTVFKRPNGQSGPVDWICVTPEELDAAGGDPFKVPLVSFIVFQEPPPQRVIELPDPTPAAQ